MVNGLRQNALDLFDTPFAVARTRHLFLEWQRYKFRISISIQKFLLKPKEKSFPNDTIENVRGVSATTMLQLNHWVPPVCSFKHRCHFAKFWKCDNFRFILLRRLNGVWQNLRYADYGMAGIGRLSQVQSPKHRLAHRSINQTNCPTASIPAFEWHLHFDVDVGCWPDRLRCTSRVRIFWLMSNMCTINNILRMPYGFIHAPTQLGEWLSLASPLCA